jgi:biopolymer transport protein ExbD
MAGAVDQDDDDVIASINMVPFIDICLVLLIIFMVTSSYIVRTAFEVELPQAASGSNVAPSTLAIEVRRDGALLFNGTPTTLDQIESMTRAMVVADENTQAIIAGDRAVDYGVVIDVVDAIKAGGIRSFALNIEREAPSP